MFFLISCFVVVAIPYGLERFYFVKKSGFFAALFWLFVFQSSVLIDGEIILENQLGHSLPGWVSSIGLAIAALSAMTISIAPLVAVLAALIVVIVFAAKWFRTKAAENSD